MQFPNKLYSYKNSTLTLIPKVLSKIKDTPIPVFALYDILKPELSELRFDWAALDKGCVCRPVEKAVSDGF